MTVALSSVIANTLMITGFVMVMMLVVEYFNIISRGWVGQRLARSGWLQILIAALLGATPGCLGAFTVVALFSHRALSLGALTAAMIATSGDEAFVMFAMIPRTALPLTAALLGIGFVVGWLTDRIAGTRLFGSHDCCDEMEVHEHHVELFGFRSVPQHFRHLSFPRALLVGGTLLVIFGVCSGYLMAHDHDDHDHDHAHEHATAEMVDPSAIEGAWEIVDVGVEEHPFEMDGRWNWLRITFLLIALLALFIVTLAPEHFLDEHLWRHVVRRHLPPLLLWTFAALSVLAIMQQIVSTGNWHRLPPVPLTGAAALLGVIPQSGPHLIFVAAYAKGLVPLVALVVSSIVQDGHGMLPLLAHSRRAFFLVKGINLLAGLAVGALMLLFR
ncbi:MAG: hypothetical protein GY835_11025 [bacterium]|nr:hypothetical protein [bacterium]